MLLADHLSRAAQQEIIKPEDLFQVFSVELENTNPMQALKLSPERLEQLQRCTEQEDDNPVRMAYSERAGAHQHQRILELSGRAFSTYPESCDPK